MRGRIKALFKYVIRNDYQFQKLTPFLIDFYHFINKIHCKLRSFYKRSWITSKLTSFHKCSWITHFQLQYRLSIKALITTAAVDIFIFSEKIRLDISCKLSPRKTIKIIERNLNTINYNSAYRFKDLSKKFGIKNSCPLENRGSHLELQLPSINFALSPFN